MAMNSLVLLAVTVLYKIVIVFVYFLVRPDSYKYISIFKMEQQYTYTIVFILKLLT